MTAAVLVVIGIGVGVLVGSGSTLVPVGTISGRVFGSSGIEAGYAPLQLSPPFQGHVTLMNVATGAEFIAPSDSAGDFSLEVPPGTYSVGGGPGSAVFYRIGHGLRTTSFPHETVRVEAGRTTVVLVSLCVDCQTG